MEDDSSKDHMNHYSAHHLVVSDGVGRASNTGRCEGLVFGELEEEEEFKTPLAASRSSSGGGETLQNPQGVGDGEQGVKQTVCGAADSDALTSALQHVHLQQQQQQHEAAVPAAGDDAGTTGETPTAAVTTPDHQSQEASGTAAVESQPTGDSPAYAQHQTADKAASEDLEEAGVPVTQLPQAAADNGGHGAPQLQAASLPAQPTQGPAHQRRSSLPEPQIWREGSGLVTLAVQGQQHSSVGTGSDDEDTDSEASWAAFEQTGAVAAPDVAADAAADAATALSPFEGASTAAAAPRDSGAASPATAAVTPRQQLQPQQQAPRSPGSIISLGSLGSPRAPGVERTASWQLQHAAAAAAGTAAHPAPPRSDLRLTRLSSSPSSPHGEDGWAAWQRRRRHFFVLTAAGKPVFSLHGDEQALAGFMAVVQALVSVIADQGDSIRSIMVGPTQLVFLLKGQLYLVAVSSRGEAPTALRRQLELLYQTILMFVTGGLEKMLHRNPGYDVQQLLTGSKTSLAALTSSFADCTGWMMGSVEPAAAAAPDRQAAAEALQAAVKSSDALYGVLLVGGRVLGAETGKGPPPLNVYDLLLLANFTNSNESLRHSETFVPVCLPNFQPNAFLHAYIANLEPPQQQSQQDASTQQQDQSLQQQPQQQQQQCGRHSLQYDSSNSIFLLLLSGSADSFHKLSAAKQVLAAALGGASDGVLSRVAAASAARDRGRLGVDRLPAPLGGSFGSTPLWHAVIRLPQRRQHITLSYPRELFSERRQRKQLIRSYCRLYCAAYAQLLEAELPGSKGSSGMTSQPGGPGSSSGPAGGTAGVTSAAASIANIVGAGSGSMGSGAAAAAAAAAAYMLPYAGGQARGHKLVWVTNQRWVTGVVVDRDVEVYVTFDPLTEKEVGLQLVEQLRRYFGDKGQQQEMLVPGL